MVKSSIDKSVLGIEEVKVLYLLSNRAKRGIFEKDLLSAGEEMNLDLIGGAKSLVKKNLAYKTIAGDSDTKMYYLTWKGRIYSESINYQRYL